MLANAKSRYKRIVARQRDLAAWFAKAFLQLKPARRIKDFIYRTRKSGSRERRVVGKAEHLAKGSNPRLVVTSLSEQRFAVQALYADRYCGRGDMENRI